VSISQYIDARRREVEAALANILPAPPDCPPVVHDAMRYSLLGGGKRLRPVLCLASADAVGGDRAAALPAACAIELIHTYSLIHDDLPAMDNDTMRRGRPTLHVVVGEGQAILAGDGLLTEAFNILSRSPRPTDYERALAQLDVIRVIAAAAGAVGMVGGQAIDLFHSGLGLPAGASAKAGTRDSGLDGLTSAQEASDNGAPGPSPAPLDADGLRRMHGKKTGALIRAAATAGAMMGGGTGDQVKAIDEAAGEFGLAFQIVDDVLDVEGASSDLGKTAGKDAAAGKLTYSSLYGLEQSKQMAAACLERAEAALRRVALADSPLMAIGRWIVERKN
jgi:geranylgeranyl diphosphate synthase, type II